MAAIVASVFFAMQTLEGLVIGMVFQVFSITALEITLNLHLMEYIPRKEMGKFEPMRVFSATGVWAVGPWLCIFLKTHFGEYAPFIGTSFTAIAILSAFWYLRFNDDPVVSDMKKKLTNPIRFVGRFFSQPRLMLAWSLAFGRSSWCRCSSFMHLFLLSKVGWGKRFQVLSSLLESRLCIWFPYGGKLEPVGA